MLVGHSHYDYVGHSNLCYKLSKQNNCIEYQNLLNSVFHISKESSDTVIVRIKKFPLLGISKPASG